MSSNSTENIKYFIGTYSPKSYKNDKKIMFCKLGKELQHIKML